MSLPVQKQQKLKIDLLRYIQAKQYKKAEKTYLKYKNADINNIEIWRYFAGIHSVRNNFTELAHCCRKILKLSPDDFQSNFALAVALQNINQFDEAIIQYNKAISINSSSPEVHLQYSQLLMSQGDYTSALEQLKIVRSILPENKQALFMIAQCYYEQGNYIESEKNYINFLNYDKNNFNAINNLGRLYEEAGKPEMAIERFQQALKINNDIAITHLNLGKVLVKTEQFEQAEKEFLYASKLEPEHPEPYFNIGKIYNKKDDIQTAKQYFIKALDADIKKYMQHTDEFIHAVRFYLSNIDDPERFNDDKKEFVAELFDGYAEKFDDHLINGLQYKTPEIFNKLITSHITKKDNITMDLGCGTGLCCKYLRGLSKNLTGVDLSAGMIEKARELHCYDKLIIGEITEALNNNNKVYDLIVAADVFVYIASLKDIFSASYNNLSTGGFFIFSTELLDDELNSNYIHCETGRYKHSTNYINQLVSDNNFDLIEHNFCTLRKDYGKDVTGCVTVLRKHQDILENV